VSHVENITGVDVMVERLLNQLLRFIAGQLRHSTHAQICTHTTSDSGASFLTRLAS